mmetsp:Transcript_6105/g.8882  ORF Transcript_6105/g.8882 Transcript_6105/m.8882 type:complete len:531 (+) Transcript_6105:271-1863(+)|eukprot:CAMPEP_0184861418 /NCGR_PEP_ID=MMETSP0580-20130426/6104_1 /TAXON_ID=1118495 /ORGANISM="Dactyliosolen fragilissimus" /LENGTH=530 /DNA_ID=CAMNT_0027358909 /DNA_START=134 /DNA_END=1726 /DNA_ORIENTATION=-
MFNRNPQQLIVKPGRKSKEPPPIDYLKLKPPGFVNQISIPFPDRKLPVCLTCKRNYKTRELCRTRDQHSGLPWTTTYICITLEKSCFDEQNKLRENVKFEAKPLPIRQPYCFSHKLDSSTAICHACKEKNYTRHYCREKLKHRQLPWPSAYASMYVGKGEPNPQSIKMESTDSSIIKKEYPVKDEQTSIKKEAGSEAQGIDDPEESIDRPAKKMKEGPEQESEVGLDNKKTDEVQSEGAVENIFSEIPETTTFLAIVSSHKCSYEWLDVDPSAPDPVEIQTEFENARRERAAAQSAPHYGQEYPSMYGYSHSIQHPGLPDNFMPTSQMPRQPSMHPWVGGSGFSNMQRFSPPPDMHGYSQPYGFQQNLGSGPGHIPSGRKSSDRGQYMPQPQISMQGNAPYDSMQRQGQERDIDSSNSFGLGQSQSTMYGYNSLPSNQPPHPSMSQPFHPGAHQGSMHSQHGGIDQPSFQDIPGFNIQDQAPGMHQRGGEGSLQGDTMPQQQQYQYQQHNQQHHSGSWYQSHHGGSMREH